MRSIKVNIPGSTTCVILYANVFAQSAFDHDATLEDFKASLDNFSRESRSSFPQIQAWREEATEVFFNLLKEAGKLKLRPEEFLGGSDYEEVNEATLDNKNTKE